MHFPDLALCEYDIGPTNAEEWRVPLPAVGWLEHPHDYSRGNLPSSVRGRLLELRDQTLHVFWYEGYCGLHHCSFCHAADDSIQLLHGSNNNIFVPGNQCVYVATGGIDHYFEVHSYCPPKEFCDAVLLCADCGTPEYWDAIRRSNGGPVPIDRLVKVREGDSVRNTDLELSKGEWFRLIPDDEF